MDIRLSSTNPRGFLPEAYKYLCNVPDLPAGRQKHYRPPLAIYNISIDRVLAAMESVIDEVISIEAKAIIPKPGQGLDWLDSIILSHLECLNAMQSHLDDCDRIATSVCVKGDVKNEELLRRYKSMTKAYRDRINRIVNHIKHHQGRLRAFAFYTRTTCFPGYYVEGADSEGVVGPEPTVHKRGRGAFSFSRDLRLHFVWLYGLSSYLSELLSPLATECPLPSPKTQDDRYIRIARKLASTQFLFYPDEGVLPVPEVSFIESRDVSRAELAISYMYETTVPLIRRGPGLKIALSWKGDGVSMDWRLPYEYRPGLGNVGISKKPGN